jgi:uncharacterized protein (DUF433 family)
MNDLSEWLVRDPEILSGRFIFVGTRVPVEVLFENLQDGMSLDDILDSYPTIPKPAAVALLAASKNAILERALGKNKKLLFFILICVNLIVTLIDGMTTCLTRRKARLKIFRGSKK